MIKKRRTAFIVIFLVVLLIPLLSAGFLDNFVAKITGDATTSTTTVTVILDNTAPTIDIIWNQSVTAPNPTEAANTTIIFNFSATDADGTDDLNDATAQAFFIRAGEGTRANATCQPRNTSGNTKNYSCRIFLTYYDITGEWVINTSIKDDAAAHISNSSANITYGLLTAMVMSPTALTWPSLSISSTNTGSNNDPVRVNNTGNDVDLDVNITGLDLQGNVTLTDYIGANNFTIDNVTEGCSGSLVINNSGRNITRINLSRGDNSGNTGTISSGQDELFFCLTSIPQTISAQNYSSAGFGVWTITILT